MEYTNKEIVEYMNDQENLIMLFNVKYESLVLGRRYECLVGTIEKFNPKGYRKIDIVQDMILSKKFIDENSNGALELYKGKLQGIPLDRERKVPGIKIKLEEMLPYENYEWSKVIGDKCEEIAPLNYPTQ